MNHDSSQGHIEGAETGEYRSTERATTDAICMYMVMETIPTIHVAVLSLLSLLSLPANPLAQWLLGR